jgi:hypothetical protein
MLPDKPQPTLEELRKMLAPLVDELSKSSTRGKRRMSYYTPKYAAWARELIDKVISTGSPYMLPVGDLVMTSLRLQWCQATQYLVEHEDPKGEYAEKRKMITAERVGNRGIMISPKRVTGLLKAYQTEDWKVRFLEWVDQVQPQVTESGNLPVFERIGIGLSSEDAKWLNDYLMPLDDLFVWSCDTKHDALKVIRVDKSKVQEVLSESP